jgi:hypothetical protein
MPILVIAVGWVLIFLATRGEAVSLLKMEKPRGSIRSTQIVHCDVKKLANPAAAVPRLDFEAAMFGDFSGFLLSPRLVPGNFGPRLGTECVLLV